MISFLYRLSFANHQDSLTPIGDELGLKWWELPLNTFNKEACEKISALSGINKKILYSKSYHSMLTKLNEKQIPMWFHGTRIKYCPKCLADKKIHQFLWGLKPISLCTRHNVILMNACPSCHSKIDLQSLINGKCGHCNFHLVHAEPLEINRNYFACLSQYSFQQLINGNGKNEFKGLSPIQVMVLYDSLFRLFDGFNSFIDTNVNLLGNKIVLKASNDEERTLSFANAYWMIFEDFPNNFIHALNVFYNSDSSRKKYRKRHFSNFLSNHCEFNFIKKEFELFKENQVKNGLVPRNIETYDATSASKLKQLYYTKKDIFQKYHITRGEIEKLCEGNLLKPKKVVIESHKNYYFDKKETEIVLKTYLKKDMDLITKKEAATFLGVSVESLSRLIDKNMIIEQEASIKKQFSFVSKKSIQSLLHKLSKRIKTINKNESNQYISFEKCLDKFVTSGLQIAKLVEWALYDIINVYSIEDGVKLNQLYFDEKEIKIRLQAEDIENNGYNLADVSRIFGFTERTLHKMIQANLINPYRQSLSKNGRRIYYFDKRQIDDFKETYISPMEASIKYKVSYSTLNNFSHKNILKNYMKGICQKTLFKKEELERELTMRKLIKTR